MVRGNGHVDLKIRLTKTALLHVLQIICFLTCRLKGEKQSVALNFSQLLDGDQEKPWICGTEFMEILLYFCKIQVKGVLHMFSELPLSAWRSPRAYFIIQSPAAAEVKSLKKGRNPRDIIPLIFLL